MDDLGDLLVALPLQFPQDEHLPMVGRELDDGPVHQLPKLATGVELVGPGRRIFIFERAEFVLPFWR